MKKSHLTYLFVLLSSFLCTSQNLTQEEVNHLKKQAIVLDTNAKYADLKWGTFIEKFKSKKLLLLGEFNHGSKEIFTLRNDLIKSLHNNYGYNVILFESGIGEMAGINLNKENLSNNQLVGGFFGGWRTKEFQELMAFVKDENISVAGFDVQRTGNNFSELFTRSELDKKVSSTIVSLETRFSKAKQIVSNRKSNYDSIQESIQKLIIDYEQLRSHFDDKPNKTNSQQLINRTLYNRTHYLTYMLDWQKTKDWNARWKSRDSVMADNVSWLITNFFPNDKVIVIAHNFHIAKYNKKEEVMGEFLKSRYKEDMYSLGVFAAKGVYSNNSGKPEELSIPDNEALDIKHVINSLSGTVNFLAIPSKETSQNKWLFNDIIVNDTFINLSSDNQMNLSKHFDGLLLIDRISVPEKQ